VLNVLVAQIVLQGASIVAVIGQLEAAGMTQHVRMDGERYLGGFAEPYHEMVEAHGDSALYGFRAVVCAELGFHRPESDGHSVFRAWLCVHAACPGRARSDAIRGRRLHLLVGHDDRRPGSWWHRDDHGDSLCGLCPSVARSRAR